MLFCLFIVFKCCCFCSLSAHFYGCFIHGRSVGDDDDDDDGDAVLFASHSSFFF